MPLEIEKLSEITNKIYKEIMDANRMGYLNEWLKEHAFEGIDEEKDSFYFDSDNSKIIVIGDFNENVARKCIKDVGLDKHKFEFYSDYTKLSQYNFLYRIRENSNFSDVMICQNPHSIRGKGEYSSIVSAIETEQEKYPKLTKIVTESGEIKFTKTGFKDALKKTNAYKAVFETILV